MEIRQPTEDERDQVASVLRVSLNLPHATLEERASKIPLDYLSPFDAVRLGLLNVDDPAVPFLAKLFSGPSPWMHDFF